MNKIKILFTIIIMITGLTVQGFCADVAKIGIIDFQKILIESSAGKMAQKKINEKGAELKNKLQEMKDAVEELNMSLERESLVMSAEKRNEKQREIRIKVNDFKQQQVEFEREFKQLEARIVQDIQKEVFELAQIIGKEDGYLLIIGKQAAGVIYSPDHINITDLVIQRYNKQFAEKK